ncbi:hypothetical protein, partial [Streptomyces mesophilus]|uniref:hypothetical protein n=1 Tax=Streptomyces mesophilus TaxID=1775132 RepID=UPI00332A03E8
MSVPSPIPGLLRRPGLLRALLLVLLTLALAAGAPPAAATVPAAQPAVTGEAETAECGGDS